MTSLKVAKKHAVMMPVYLHKGSWREFKIALALHLKGSVKHWDSHLSRKIFMILQGEEIRKRFLSAFPPLSRYEKLDLSLDDIINPIEILEKKSHRKGCHPGRLTLDPERYNRAWGDNRHFRAVRARVPPPHMMAGFLATPWGKHRLLDVSEDIENPHRRALKKDKIRQRELNWGLQDIYFLGGMPLEYWCNGDSMGMAVPMSLPCSENYQWPGKAFRAQTDEEAGEYEDFSRVTMCCRTYCFSRMWYLPAEVEWGGERGWKKPAKLFFGIHERFPRTLNGNEWWITGQAEMSGLDQGGQGHVHFAYIKYIQNIEDFDEAVKRLGERVLNFDRRAAQELTLWGSSELPPI